MLAKKVSLKKKMLNLTVFSHGELKFDLFFARG